MQNANFIKVIVAQDNKEVEKKLAIADIVYFKASSEEFLIYHSVDKTMNCNKNRAGIVKQNLCSRGFIEINREAFVNPAWIKQINPAKRSIVLEGETELHVSRRKWHKIKNIVGVKNIEIPN